MNNDEKEELLNSQPYNNGNDDYEAELERNAQDMENYNRAYRSSRTFRKKVLNNRFGKQLKMSAY
jgi:hypothetical protein